MVNLVDLLVIGGSSFVGANLVQAALHSGLRVAYTYANRKLNLPVDSFQVNLQEANTLEACLAETKPKNIAHCAIPRGDEKIHQAVSVESVSRIIGILNNALTTKLIYVSSNAVFTGDKGQYGETDLPDAGKRNNEYCVYAIARAAGDHIALEKWPNTIVVRTADVNGRDVESKLNIRLEKLVEKFKTGQTIQRLSQAYIPPTLVDNLVDVILELIGDKFEYRGVLHIAGSEYRTMNLLV